MSVQKRLYRQIAIFSCSLLVVTSFAPSNVSLGNFWGEVDYAYSGEIAIADVDGYLTKINPQTLDNDRSTMSDSLTHTVVQGDTLSSIAEKYKVEVDTILWTNGLYNPDSLKIGQNIIIPPTDGVYHTVKSGETLSKIASTYGAEIDLILKQNSLNSDDLSVGQKIFVPGGKGVIPSPPTRSTYSRTVSSSRSSYVANANLANSTATPTTSKSLIWPTRGKVTQGYIAGHYALDIANSPAGPIWNACPRATVIKAQTGWNGGYGTHAILDCGGGIKTLYAHMAYLSVKVGDVVTQGQAIGQMGNTGRVYGRTGIHLHFEVRKNGVKQNPWNYF